MSTSAGPMADEDIYAFRPVPEKAAAQAAPRARRRVWPWVLGGVLLLMLLAAAAGVALLVSLLNSAQEGMHVVIGGEPWDFVGFDSLGLLPALGVAAVALVVVVLVVMLVVPLSLLLALLGTVFGLGLALAAVVLVVALTLSPLWLAVLLLWLLLRRKPAATMRP